MPAVSACLQWSPEIVQSDTHARLRQACHYESRATSPSSSTSSSPLDLEYSTGLSSPTRIKNAIAEKLTSTPSDLSLAYVRFVHPWLPIIANKLQDHASDPWNEVPLDHALLALCVDLLCTQPPLSQGETSPSSRSAYLYVKSLVAVVEGLGIISLKMIQARLLVTLFEASHGFYPAAYISIGSTTKAADALKVHDQLCSKSTLSATDESMGDETLLVVWAIQILDRYADLHVGLSHTIILCADESQIHNHTISTSPVSS